jgi:hypothetical protein
MKARIRTRRNYSYIPEDSNIGRYSNLSACFFCYLLGNFRLSLDDTVLIKISKGSLLLRKNVFIVKVVVKYFARCSSELVCATVLMKCFMLVFY